MVERPIIVHFYDIREENGENAVDSTQRETVTSHSDMLTTLAETGLFGLLTFVGLIVAVVSRQLSVFRQSLQAKRALSVAYPLGFIVTLVMYYAIGIFENTMPNITIFVFFICAASVTWMPAQHVRT